MRFSATETRIFELNFQFFPYLYAKCYLLYEQQHGASTLDYMLCIIFSKSFALVSSQDGYHYTNPIPYRIQEFSVGYWNLH